MQFENTLVQATLLKRYKRFLADVILENSTDTITVHCPNTGSMKTCGNSGDTIYLNHSKQTSRKYPYTWELTKLENGGFIGINTQRPNQIVGEALREKRIPELSSYSTVHSEVTWGDSRFDFLLTNEENGKRCWVEVKNVTLREGDFLLFPDAKTERGAKHLEHLISLAKLGDQCVMFYLINRSDGSTFDCAQSIDPHYYDLFEKAQKEGVEVLAYRSHITLESISLGERVSLSK